MYRSRKGLLEATIMSACTPDQAIEDKAYKISRHLGVPLEHRCNDEDPNNFAEGLRVQLKQLL